MIADRGGTRTAETVGWAADAYSAWCILVCVVGGTGSVACIIEIVGGIIASKTVIGQCSKTAQTIIITVETKLLSYYLEEATHTATLI